MMTGKSTSKNKIEQKYPTPQTPTHEIMDIEMTHNEQGYTTPQGKNTKHKNYQSIKDVSRNSLNENRHNNATDMTQEELNEATKKYILMNHQQRAT